MHWKNESRCTDVCWRWWDQSTGQFSVAQFMSEPGKPTAPTRACFSSLHITIIWSCLCLHIVLICASSICFLLSVRLSLYRHAGKDIQNFLKINHSGPLSAFRQWKSASSFVRRKNRTLEQRAGHLESVPNAANELQVCIFLFDVLAWKGELQASACMQTELICFFMFWIGLQVENKAGMITSAKHCFSD